MKNHEVLELKQKLDQLSESLRTLRGFKFGYALTKNFKMIADEINIINDTFKTSEDYNMFETKRVELCKQFAKKDENNEPIIITKQNQSMFDIDTESTEWINAYNDLLNDFKDVIEARNKQIEDYNAFLLEENTIEFHTISIEDVPENISVEELEAIQVFIKE